MLDRPITVPIDRGPHLRPRWLYVVTDYRYRTKEYASPKEAREAWERGERLPVFDPVMCEEKAREILKKRSLCTQ